MHNRHVVLICGPPGAGKTTHAHTLGLDVYDIDDPKWNRSERLFNRAIQGLAGDRSAQAVAIRSGASRSARTKAAQLIKATEVQVLATPAEECIRRVVARDRQQPPVSAQIAAVRSWWSRYEPDDPGVTEMLETSSVPSFAPSSGLGRRGSKPAVNLGRRGRRFTRLKREQRAKRLPCWRCGQPIDYGLQWPHPDSFSYEHKVSISTAPWLAEEPTNGASSHLRCNQSAGERDSKPLLGQNPDW